MKEGRKQPGTVYLVGAGPGDPGLITVRGLRAIREADCIVYDRLAAPELLREAKPGCELIYVGKADHRHTMPQEEISLLLVQKSREYERTVRLKGGDVYVFGRGGEEGICLREHGVPFEVISGVTSAIAGPAYAGIPVTHRGIAQGFHVVTAHSRKDELAEIDFQAMARGNETCVFLMGLGKVREIAERLIEAGMSGGMPAAVISSATTPAQRVCAARLERIADEVEREKLTSPAIIVVGETVLLREALGTPERQAAASQPAACPIKRCEAPGTPERQKAEEACGKSAGRQPAGVEHDAAGGHRLAGRRYLIPKIGGEPTRLAGLLRAEGAGVDEIIVGEIVRTGRTCSAEELRTADWLVFTSRHGVDAFFAGLLGSRIDVRSLAGCRIAVIGRQTARELERHGLYADLMPREANSDALAEELGIRLRGAEEGAAAEEMCTGEPAAEEKRSEKKATVLYIKAANADSYLREALADCCHMKEIPVYENRAVAADLSGILPPADYDGVLFTCASSAERFLDRVGEQAGALKHAISIGPKTTACLISRGITAVKEAPQSDYKGMLTVVETIKKP